MEDMWIWLCNQCWCKAFLLQRIPRDWDKDGWTRAEVAAWGSLHNSTIIAENLAGDDPWGPQKRWQRSWKWLAKVRVDLQPAVTLKWFDLDSFFKLLHYLACALLTDSLTPFPPQGLTRFCLCAPDLGLPWGELSLHIPQICPASSRTPPAIRWRVTVYGSWPALVSSQEFPFGTTYRPMDGSDVEAWWSQCVVTTEWCKFNDQPAIWGCVFWLHLHDVIWYMMYSGWFIIRGWIIQPLSIASIWPTSVTSPAVPRCPTPV